MNKLLILKVLFTSQAIRAIDKIAAFVESINTQGSGKRYTAKFMAAVEQMAQAKLQYTICPHEEFARHNYSCRNYNDWVIAFKIENNAFIVFEIVHSSLLA